MVSPSWTVTLIEWPFGTSWCLTGPDKQRYERYDRQDAKPSEYWREDGAPLVDPVLKQQIDTAIEASGLRGEASGPAPGQPPLREGSDLASSRPEEEALAGPARQPSLPGAAVAELADDAARPFVRSDAKLWA
ncbi:hypothetical protein [Caldimonas tepidiphila]|uniref:hypothetical protein n=1 Tax=Caldimonas tepidiphila TaxID=2315841 RepID=UPI000E5C530C|nr:hypothetical protein [Caldimonas tepidiphila]